MLWSFSRLNSFVQCPYQFKLQYLDKVEGESNFFAEFGTFIHKLLEKYAREELEVYELVSEYEKGYFDAIYHDAPPNKYVDLAQSYYNDGLSYLNNFDGFDEFKIIDVEKEFIFNLDGLKVRGFIDLLVKDNEGYAIVDHKSANVKSVKEKRAKEYWRQLALYSIPIKEEIGEYPKKLHINAFRKQNWLTIDFDEGIVDDVKKWMLDTVELIKKEKDWKPKSDSFFCNFLCNFRNICEYRPLEY